MARLIPVAQLLMTLAWLALVIPAGAEVPILDDQSLPGFFRNKLTIIRGPAFLARLRFPELNFLTIQSLTEHFESYATMEPAAFNALANRGDLRYSNALYLAIRRVRLGSPQEARRYLEVSNALGQGAWVPGSPSGSAVGDASWYYVSRSDIGGPSPAQAAYENRSRLKLRCVRGSFAIELTAGGYGDSENPGRAFDPPFAEQIARTYVSRLRPDQDLHDTENSFPFTAQVLSKHVKPHKGEKVRIMLSSTRYPVQYRIIITRGHEQIYETELLSESGPVEFIWDGTKQDGQRSANGSHEVTIMAEDYRAREYSTQEVSVVVNFQGK